MTVVQSLSKIAKIYNVTDINENDTTDELLDKIAGGIALGSSNVTLASPSASKKYWGTLVSDMQTGLTISGGKITGTLHKLTTGSLVDVWGEGYFMAIKFTKVNEAIDNIVVGMRPSVSSGLVPLDEDMDGVFKVTNKDKQVFLTKCYEGDLEFTLVYDLSELVLADS